MKPFCLHAGAQQITVAALRFCAAGVIGICLFGKFVIAAGHLNWQAGARS